MEINMGWISTTGERLPDIELIAAVQDALSDIPGVSFVVVDPDNGYTVRTTYTGSREGREKVYEEEMNLMDNYPDILFDFRIVSPEEV